MEIVELCGRKLPVVPQKHARLRHHLTQEDFQKILSAEYSHESYRVLCVLIPAMDPNSKLNKESGEGIHEWVWDGFQTQEGWERYRGGDRDAYDEDADLSPTPDEIVAAFSTSLNVNGVGRLGKIVGLIQAGAKLVGDQQTPTSPASPGMNGVLASTPTGTSPQT